MEDRPDLFDDGVLLFSDESTKGTNLPEHQSITHEKDDKEQEPSALAWLLHDSPSIQIRQHKVGNLAKSKRQESNGLESR